MLREIRRKLVILHNRSPFRQEVKDYLNDLEYREWISMNMELSGSGLTREQIDTILRGGYIMNASVSDHLVLDRMGQLREYIYRLTDMGASLSLQILQDMHAIIQGNGSRSELRKGNPVLQEYGYNPMMPSDIPQAMKEAVYYASARTGNSGASARDRGSNPLETAALLHNRILEIYPFKEGNEILARAVMYYILADAGYPLAALELTEQEYNLMFIQYLKQRSSQPLADLLEDAVLKRLDLMLQLTRYDN